ncbi:hypothetical protein BB559_001250 [Furculomyces boomerangus]|uniref:Uncharacterized protein n=2 Tax=Harpellales TaxID=61421 RepID=A0A2T9YTK3_9FUNG|nr:hypothetical protein BB559_002637 [Furculomyces boomerangus]PVU98805.1 hypothetical protein BB559_001250 [Furculomyces boomerangus]PWA01865.1 hypothetical protein BB558_002006 [Smittium angustum]
MNVLEKQRLYQKSSHTPIYLRTTMGRFASYSAFGLIAVGTVSTAYGLMSLIISGKRN